MAEPFADTDDITGAGYPLGTQQLLDSATFWLRYGSAQLRAKVPGINARIAAGELDADDARDVLVAAVIRVMRNPDGIRQSSETIDDYTRSRTIDTVLSTGQLAFTAAELTSLGADPAQASGTVGTVTVTGTLERSMVPPCL